MTNASAQLRTQADRLRVEADELDSRAQTLARLEFESELLQLKRGDFTDRLADMQDEDVIDQLERAIRRSERTVDPTSHASHAEQVRLIRAELLARMSSVPEGGAE